MGDGPIDQRIERVEDTRIFLRSKKTLLGRHTRWRWSIEWSGLGWRQSPRWWPTRAEAEESAFEAWSEWWRERA